TVPGNEQGAAATAAPEATTTEAAAQAQAQAPAPAQETAAPPPQQAGPTPADNAAGRIGVILGIDLPVVVRFGRTELPIRTLAKLGPGSVIELGRSPGD